MDRLDRRKIVRRWLVSLLIVAAIAEVGRRWTPPIRREIQLQLAHRAIDAGQLEPAEASLDALISQSPRATRPRLALVQVYRKQGRITEAEEALQRAIELGLTLEEARREHTLLLASQDFPRAEPTLRTRLQAHPEDEEVRQALATGESSLRR